MTQHQPKIIPVNGLMLGPCFRAKCQCGWVGPLHPTIKGGPQRASELAGMDATKHLHALETKLAMPDFMVFLNEQPTCTIDEPIWE